MNSEEIYTYILGAFEVKSFENIILNKSNKDNEQSFNDEYRNKIIETMNTDEYSNIITKLARSFMTNLVKGTQSNKFSKEDCNKILDIYQKLIENIANDKMNYEKIALEHFTNVRNFISEYTENIGKEEKENSSTYSPEFVLDILGIDKKDIHGSVLDIGCGKNGELVNYLVEQGIDAHGIDIECEDSSILEQEDWLLKEYPEENYDLITSNLTFTKKFNDANLEEQNDQECIEYATAFMKILNSLKIGGKWHYVPSVTFIEELLPEDKFEVKNTFIENNIMRTVIKRLK